jgi:hypothetical protein
MAWLSGKMRLPNPENIKGIELLWESGTNQIRRGGRMFKGELMVLWHMFPTAGRREAKNTRAENGDDDDLIS